MSPRCTRYLPHASPACIRFSDQPLVGVHPKKAASTCKFVKNFYYCKDTNILAFYAETCFNEILSGKAFYGSGVVEISITAGISLFAQFGVISAVMEDFLKMMATQKKMVDLHSSAVKASGIYAIMEEMIPRFQSPAMAAALEMPRITDFIGKDGRLVGSNWEQFTNATKGNWLYQKDIQKAASITQSALGFEKTAMALMQTRKITSWLLRMDFAIPDLIPHFKAQAYVSSIFSLRDTLFKHPLQEEDSIWVNAVDRVTAEANEILDVTQQDGLQAIVEKLDEIKNVISTELGSIREQIAKPGTSKVDIASMLIGLLSLLFTIFTYYNPKTAQSEPVVIAAEQVQAIRDSLITDFKLVLANRGRRAVVVRKAALFIRPKERTLCIGSLHPGKEVTIINVLHKWVNISYISPEDQLPTTGWVQKKYLQTIQ